MSRMAAASDTASQHTRSDTLKKKKDSLIHRKNTHAALTDKSSVLCIIFLFLHSSDAARCAAASEGSVTVPGAAPPADEPVVSKWAISQSEDHRSSDCDCEEFSLSGSLQMLYTLLFTYLHWKLNTGQSEGTKIHGWLLQLDRRSFVPAMVSGCSCLEPCSCMARC